MKLGGGSVAGTAAGAAPAAASASKWGKVLVGGGAIAGAAALGYVGYEAWRHFPVLTPEGERKRIDQQGREEYARRQRARLAVCTVVGVDLADWLVRGGLALDWPRYSKGDYAAAQAEAERGGKGLWVGSFVKPWDYRSGKAGGRIE